MDKNFSIRDLECYLNVTDSLINDLARKGNINKSDNDNAEKMEINNKLGKLHYYRKQIINAIEDKLNETFNTENKG